MIKPVFNILLAIIIVSCPTRCQLGWTDCCCGSAETTQVGNSDCCCDEQPVFDPTNLPENPVKKCKCICSGATMPDHFDLDFEIQWQQWCLLDFPLDVQSTLRLNGRLRPPDELPPVSLDGSANIGRLIRCRHCSLTI